MGNIPSVINIIGNTKSGGERSTIMDPKGIMSCLSATDYKQPKQIAIKLGNVNPSGHGLNGEVFGSDGLSPTLTTNKGEGIKIAVKEATKQGYAECRVGGQDSVNLAFPNSKTRRGRVQQDMANTLDTSCNQGIFVELEDGSEVYATWYEKEQCYVAVRKLTPKECFRLQGWTDDYFEKAQFVNTNSQLYRQAGNGVTVDVVRAIGEKISAI